MSARKMVTVGRAFNYGFQDLMVAVYETIVKQFGEKALLGVKGEGAFGRKRRSIQFVNFKINEREQRRGINEIVAVQDFSEHVQLLFEGGVPSVFINIESEKRDLADKFLESIDDHLAKCSIFKNRAFTSNLNFLNLESVNETKIVYNPEVLADIHDHLWTIIEQLPLCQQLDIKLPRIVLFEGPHGSGKTLTAMLTAKKALLNGWTFVFMEPSTREASTRSLAWTFETAHQPQYQPMLVLVEDIDREQREQDPFFLGHILTKIDGLSSKNHRLLFMLTTNHKENVADGLQRPGRINKIINFGRFESSDAERLLRLTISKTMLDPQIDWAKVVSQDCAKYTPAFIQEVGRSALLSAIRQAKERGREPLVTQEMLGRAADSLREQHRACLAKTGFA